MPVHTSCPFCSVSLQMLDARPGEPLICPKCERDWTPSADDLRPAAASPTPKLAIACPKCARRNTVPSDAGGRSFCCKQCKARVVIPRPDEVYRPGAGQSGLPLTCQQCSREFTADPDKILSWTACPGCSVIAVARPLKQSKPTQSPPSRPSPPPLPPPLPAQSAALAALTTNEPDREERQARSESPLHGHGLPRRTKLFLALGAAVALSAAVILAARAIVLKMSDSSSTVASVTNDQPLSGEQVYQRLIRCSALVARPDGMGSGFVVNSEKRLIVTNYHVVDHAEDVAVVFPLYDTKGELITDARKYASRSEEAAVFGKVIARDERRDLAIIRVGSVPDRAAAVSFARQPAATGSAVYSVGGSGAEENLLWRLTKGTVRG